MKMMTRKEFLEWFSGQVDCYEHANDPTTSGCHSLQSSSVGGWQKRCTSRIKLMGVILSSREEEFFDVENYRFFITG